MDNLFWWTGAMVWLVLGGLATWFVAELLWAAVVAVSLVKFFYESARVHSATRPQLRKAPKAFFRHWFGFVGHRAGRDRIHNIHGEWRGVGKWTVYPTPMDPYRVSHGNGDQF